MHDLRDAFRSLRATPVVTVVAILSLALGIGDFLDPRQPDPPDPPRPES